MSFHKKNPKDTISSWQADYSIYDYTTVLKERQLSDQIAYEQSNWKILQSKTKTPILVLLKYSVFLPILLFYVAFYLTPKAIVLLFIGCKKGFNHLSPYFIPLKRAILCMINWKRDLLKKCMEYFKRIYAFMQPYFKLLYTTTRSAFWYLSEKLKAFVNPKLQSLRKFSQTAFSFLSKLWNQFSHVANTKIQRLKSLKPFMSYAFSLLKKYGRLSQKWIKEKALLVDKLFSKFSRWFLYTSKQIFLLFKKWCLEIQEIFPSWLKG